MAIKAADKKISTDDAFKLVMHRKWKQIIDCYEQKSLAPNTRITQSRETALHVAVSSLHNDEEAELIITMIEYASSDDLKLKNENGDTPLHLAATAGLENICNEIVKKDKTLIGIRNNTGETPLFVAAHHGRHEAFLSLHEAYLDGRKDDSSLVPLFTRSEDGNTILHSAIAGEYFRLANWIIQKYGILSSRKNVNGETPLHFLAKKPNVFKSSSSMGPIESVIYYCVLIEKMKSSDCFPKSRNTTASTRDVDDLKYPPNYKTCMDAFGLVKTLLKICFPDLSFRKKNNRGLDDDEENQNHEEHKSRTDQLVHEKHTVCPGEETKHEDLFPAHCATCVISFYFMMKILLTILGLGFWKIKKIKDQKQKNTHAEQVMKYLIDSTSTYQYAYDGQDPNNEFLKYPRIDLNSAPPVKPITMDEDHSSTPPKNSAFPQSNPVDVAGTKSPEVERAKKQDTPILIAVKNGISEMVEEIFRSVPISIHDKDSKGKNLLLVAAENRQTTVLRFLLKKKPPEYVIHRVDEDGNGILHLAARLEKDFHPWKIPGAALQMQRELIWYRYVKKSFPSLSFADENKKGDIPNKIFTETHKDLVKEGAEWLRKTSESCSVIAALIAGVAFATSASVPGGTDDQTGLPKLQGRANFDIFSVASLLALCLSVTSLVCFLAIITSRFEEKNFRMNLPMKLMLGLSGLFMSIAAMLVSFSAGHSFILGNKMKIASLPIYMTVTIPLMIFLIAQLPLYVDLFQATLVRVPLRSYKVYYQ